MIKAFWKFFELKENKMRQKIFSINNFFPYDVPLGNLSYTVLDIETTGLKPYHGDEIISLGAVKIINLQISRPALHAYVNPKRELPQTIQNLTGIKPAMLKNAPPLSKTLNSFLDYAQNTILVGHSLNFDLAFLNKHLIPLTGKKLSPKFLDTLDLGMYLFPHEKSYALEAFARKFAVDLKGRHTALGDAVICAKVFLNFLKILEKININTWWKLSRELYKVL